MNQYLLVAEADQIQDFIFRASHLQEVIGGSQLLHRFEEIVPAELLKDKPARLLVSGGGKFIVEFDDQEAAYSFGEELAEAYHRATDCTLTVADPEPLNGDFGQARSRAEKKLRQAKRWRSQARQATAHLPHIALCASCGIGLATTYHNLHEGERKKYLCSACHRKANKQESDRFVRSFMEKVVGPEHIDQFAETKRPLHVSGYDRRRYVAYLVADGNHMGQVFERCNRDNLKKLSQKMKEEVLPTSLVKPTSELMKQIRLERHQVPVWPLILGGDDVFALLPAPWALDFAMRFCQTFEQEMAKAIVELNLNEPGQEPLRPTMSAAIVVCKETYPHTLAHQAGQTCLEQAKQFSKSLKYDTGLSLSTVNFTIITNNDVTDNSDAKARPTLRPYYVLTTGSSPKMGEDCYPESTAPETQLLAQLDGHGLPLHCLSQQRWALRGVAHKPLQHLRRHFEQLSSHDLPEWKDNLEKLLQHITRRDSDQQQTNPIQQAVVKLGRPKPDWLYKVNRITEKEIWEGHALPDLLEAWDFAFCLDKQKDDYGES